MTTDLDLRLASLSTAPVAVPPLEVVLERARRNERQRRRRAVGVAGSIAAALMAVALILSNHSDPSDHRVVTGNSTTVPNTTPPLALKGYQAVSGPGGGIAGFIDDADLRRALDHGEPLLDVGTGAYPLRGFKVFDTHKQLVGYFLDGDPGFVPLHVMADQATADQYGKDQAADGRKPMDETVRKMIEDLDRQAHGN